MSMELTTQSSDSSPDAASRGTSAIAIMRRTASPPLRLSGVGRIGAGRSDIVDLVTGFVDESLHGIGDHGRRPAERDQHDAFQQLGSASCRESGCPYF